MENTEGIRRVDEFITFERSTRILLRYTMVAEKAKQGDDKAVKTFLTLQNEIRKSVKNKNQISRNSRKK